MKNVDYLIVGGSAAGTTAAEVIRGIKTDASITIVSDESHEQYSRVLMPHYVRHKVNREQVFLKKPDWYSQKNIELVKGVKAVLLEPKSHRVKVSNGSEYQYGKLLIAIGGDVIKLKVSGSDLENALYMRTIDDGDEIIKVAKASKKAVIIGGGFIGLEFCSCFRANGVSDITVLVLEDYYWQGKLDEASSKVLTNTLEKNGVKILVNEEVDNFQPKRGPTPSGVEPLNDVVGAIQTKSGRKFGADVVGVGIGIKSDLSWLEGSGIKINRAIVTNEYLETGVSDIYAAGDCAEFWDVIFERQHIMGNWANATSQGLVVGKTMSGNRTVFETASSYSINFFDGSCSFIGVTDEKFADQIIVRGSVETNKISRIFIKAINGLTRIVGATVINDPAQVSPVTTAIKSKKDISSLVEKLSDRNFPLNNLNL